jgi:hypothetical protein
VDAGGGDQITRAQAERACLMYGSCIDTDGVSACYVDNLPTLPTDVITCLVAADNCAAARACVGQTWTTSSSCTPSGKYCVGNTVENCNAVLEQSVMCGAPTTGGSTCATALGTPICSAGTCTGTSTCAGTVAQTCFQGQLTQLDCAAAGLPCILDGRCSEADGAGNTCTTGGDTCDGTTWVSCYGGIGIAIRVDCAKRFEGATCIQPPAGDAYCGWAQDCAPHKGNESCTGTTLTYCAGGATETVDCATIGSTCSTAFNNGCSPI